MQGRRFTIKLVQEKGIPAARAAALRCLVGASVEWHRVVRCGIASVFPFVPDAPPSDSDTDAVPETHKGPYTDYSPSKMGLQGFPC